MSYDMGMKPRAARSVGSRLPTPSMFVVLVAAQVALVAPSACSSQADPDGSPGDDGATADGAAPDSDLVDGAAGDDGGEPILPTPIRYVVVLVKENRTFDNLFGAFPGAEGTLTAKLSNGTTIARPVAPQGGLPRDVIHDHRAAFKAYADGGMNGFDLLLGAHPTDGGADDFLPFVYYPRDRIPNYYTLAENFVLCDHFFSTTLGPTFPGHLATVAAQSPAYDNPTCDTCTSSFEWGCMAPAKTRVGTFDPDTCATTSAPPCFDIPSVVDSLPQGFGWRAYGPAAGGGILTPFQAVKSVGGNTDVRKAHFRDQNQAPADLAHGDQEHVTFINVSAGEISEHPPQDPCDGENYTVSIVNALMKGPHWSESALVITWDDWGGLYDHVVPLVNQKAASCGGAFFNTGFRVPALIVSPYAKRGYIKKGGAEQASIPRLIEELFGMPPLHDRDPRARDALAGTLLDAFDFTAPARAPEPLTPRTCP